MIFSATNLCFVSRRLAWKCSLTHIHHNGLADQVAQLSVTLTSYFEMIVCPNLMHSQTLSDLKEPASSNMAQFSKWLHSGWLKSQMISQREKEMSEQIEHSR